MIVSPLCEARVNDPTAQSGTVMLGDFTQPAEAMVIPARTKAIVRLMVRLYS
jgi:hypothetical protein